MWTFLYYSPILYLQLQVRVTEGKEPACFLNLFKGRMMIHVGKREEEDTNTQGPWRMYCLRGEYEREMCLIEVRLSPFTDIIC